MQYEKRRTKSTLNFLVQQVQEQSDLCDVVVKMGYWKKKFHRCVLVVSPFFEHALKNNFLEKQTGTIEMTTGTPLTLEMAIMFLYGKEPKFTQENIGNMIDLAEFLLIPDLKSACISWLRTVAVTEKNCIKLLHLSSLYGFELKRCVHYLMSHMTEMLKNQQMVHMTKDSIQELFLDRKLSYVPMDDKVNFLLRWTNFQPTMRKTYLTKLFATIDFNEVSKTVIEELRAYKYLSAELEEEIANIAKENEDTYAKNVLVMERRLEMGTFWCLDLDKGKWFRLDIRSNKEQKIPRYGTFSIGKANSEIYFTDIRHKRSVLSCDLETDTCNVYTLVNTEADNGHKYFDNVRVMGDMCVATINELVKKNKQTSDSDSQPSNIEDEYPILELYRRGMLAFGVFQNIRGRNYFRASTLYAGYRNDEHFEMSPLISIKDDKISGVCVNETLTIAMTLPSTVKVFDLKNYKLETIQAETTVDDIIVQNHDGFIIYNTKRCICLTRDNDLSLLAKFQTKEIEFTRTHFYHIRYVFCENTWYRYFHEKCGEPYVFESASHSDVMSRGSFEDVVWKQLPLPKEESNCDDNTISNSLYKVSLPKSKLRCDIECPHCKVKSGAYRTTNDLYGDFDDDDNCYEDSSDEDLPVFDDDDFDDDYDFEHYVGSDSD